MKHHWQNYKTYYLIAGYTALVVLLFLLVAIPSYRKARTMLDVAQQYEMDKLSIEQRLGEVRMIEGDKLLFDNTMSMLDQTLLEENNMVAFIEKLEEISQAVSVDTAIQVLDPQIVAQKRVNADSLFSRLGKLEVVHLKLTLEGTFGHMVEFINKIESLDNYVTVYLVDFSKSNTPTTANDRQNPFSRPLGVGTAPSGSKLTASIQLIVYVK